MIHRILIAICIMLLTVPVWAADDNDKELVLAGKVTDKDGVALDGVEVQAFGRRYNEMGAGVTLTPIGKTVTKEDGIFSFVSDDETSITQIIARKEGFSLGWENYYRTIADKPTLEIQLGPPHELSGTVTDQQGLPIPNAEVRGMLVRKSTNQRYATFYSVAPTDVAVATTDENGRFSLNDIPEDASAEFLVNAKEYAQVSTYAPTVPLGQFKAGQTDIKIELPKEAIVQGKVVDAETAAPISGVELFLLPGARTRYTRCSDTSDENGAFRVGGLAPGEYTVRMPAVHSKEGGYVAEPVPLTIEKDGLIDDVLIKAQKGHLIEIKTVDEVTKTPVANAHILLHNLGNSENSNTRTEEDGLARFWVMPGEYEINYVTHQDYGTLRPGERITLEKDKPATRTIALKEKPKITGTALDAAGNPVAGAVVSLCPMQGTPQRETDAEGKFSAIWDPQQWVPRENMIPLLFVRHLDRNLAGAVDVSDLSKPVTITLKPGVSIVGKIVDPDDKPIAGATALIYVRVENMSTSMTRDVVTTDENGKYEFKAIPPERNYSVHVNADGYGTGQREAYIIGALDTTEVDTITLQVANLSLSGKIVDTENKPVANAQIYAHGQGQPTLQGFSDKEGKFALNGACEGTLTVNASVQQGGSWTSGSTSAQAGDVDVVVVIGQEVNSGRTRPPAARTLVDTALPDVSSLGIDLAADALKDRPVLICFWNMNQRPSRHCLQTLAWKANLLKQKGIAVLAVHSEPVDAPVLEERTRELRLTFPVGVIAENPEVVQSAWGVQGLPWLILTDKEHKVVKEGFPISELDAALAEVTLAE